MCYLVTPILWVKIARRPSAHTSGSLSLVALSVALSLVTPVPSRVLLCPPFGHGCLAYPASSFSALHFGFYMHSIPPAELACRIIVRSCLTDAVEDELLCPWCSPKASRETR